MKYPNSLKKGDSIGLIAPTEGCSSTKKQRYLDLAIKNMNKIGLNVVEGKNIRNMKYLVSDTAKNRADEFIRFFKDENIKYIFSVAGGSFLIDILPYLDERKDEIKAVKNIKYFHGYSDNSLLNMYLTTNFNIPTVNGQTFTHFCMKDLDKSLENILDFMFLAGKEFKQTNFKKWELDEFDNRVKGYNLTKRVKYKVLDENKKKIQVSGRIIGGCLEATHQLIGTNFDNVANFCKKQEEGVIWYIDIFEDDAVSIYSKLNQMKNAGWFENVKAILIGRTYGGKAFRDFDYICALKKALYDLNVPVIYDVDIGHTVPQLTLINGSLAFVTYENNKFEIVQKFV